MSRYNTDWEKINIVDPKCRTCNDFKTWAKKQKEILNSSNIKQDQTVHLIASETDPHRSECPLDKDELGRSTWGLLHTMGATYPTNPTNTQKKQIKEFFEILGNSYPCEHCAHDLRKELQQEPVDGSSQERFSQWLCRLHNKVNKKLQKPLFDCSRVNERWRDGWKDGSCD